MKAKRKIATAASIAPIEFEAIEDLAAMSKEERLKAAHDIMDEIAQVRPFMVAVGEVLALDKKGLIARVSEHPEIWADIMVQIGQARDTFKAAQDSVDAAEMRLMIAVSNVARGQAAA